MKKHYFLYFLLISFYASAQNMTWTDVSATYNMPNGVKVYSGLDASIPLKVKYIDVDLNITDLELTPVLSATPTHSRNHAKNLGAVAVMNGGYFSGSTSFSAVVNSTVEAKNTGLVTRNGVDYPLTRGFFGFNNDGSMAVNWIYHFGATKNDIYTYTTPAPNADGTPAATPTIAGGTQWTTLAKGMGAGPVLIKSGNIVNTYTEEVFWGSGVSNTGLDPRSAIGYTADKHVILMVADGRQAGISAGASLPQMAAMLQSLGCTEALNCDGGGSTQLATATDFINTPSESFRSVPSVWAVYKKATLETPTPTTPADGASTQANPVTISWNMPTETGCTYRIQIATSKSAWNKNVGFTAETTTNTTVLTNETNTTGTYNLTNTTIGTTYFWSIVAYKNGTQQSYYSEPRSFLFSNGEDVDWKRAAVNTTKPTWFGTDTERGLAYANNKVYIVSRNNAATSVKIVNYNAGADVGELLTTGITGGTHALSDIEASQNGMLLGCNLTTSAAANFKVYKWDSETATPTVFIDYVNTGGLRLGDKFTVQGDITQNAVIFAASPTTKVIRWLVTNGVLQAPTEITLPTANGNMPTVTATGLTGDSDIFVNSQAKFITLHSSTGTLKGNIGASIMDSDSNSTKYFELDSKKYLAVFQSKQTAGSPIGNNCRIIDITDGIATAKIVATTDRLGDVTNGNAAGDIDVRFTTTPVSLTVFTIATNNGISGKRIFGVLLPDSTSNNTLSLTEVDFEKNQTLKIYPNPIQSDFTIDFEGVVEKNATVTLISMEGKQIQTTPLVQNKQNINANTLPKGMYLLTIQNGSKRYQTKLIKQ